MHTFTKFVPLMKVDAAQREVYGVVTSETPDKDGEICDYASTAPYYRAWSAEFEQATGGKSLGNVREMHTRSAVGKVTDLIFDDAGKSVAVHAKIVDDAAWAKCEQGVYTGFSHGGEYVGEPWPDGAFMRYTAKPSEISLVDNPCNPEAHFEYVKADGSVELRKFANPHSSSASLREGGASRPNDQQLTTGPNFAGGDPTPEPPPSDPADSNNAALPAKTFQEVSSSEFPVSSSGNPTLATGNQKLGTGKLGEIVLQQQQQIADLAGAVKNLTEALKKVMAEPQQRKTAGAGVVVTKEQDSEIFDHNPETRKSSDPKALLKECLRHPVELGN